MIRIKIFMGRMILPLVSSRSIFLEDQIGHWVSLHSKIKFIKGLNFF